ncbi:alpha/beta hydrolase [Pseudomonas thivervalensis]|uniref:alpha/beta hydrolase n=1 Tax=Pseudomonas thivervalensis TaxID=86265 RepID=UPI003D99BF71
MTQGIDDNFEGAQYESIAGDSADFSAHREGDEQKGILFVLLHSYMNGASTLGAVREKLEKLWPGERVFCPELPVGTYSLADPDQIVIQLLEDMDHLVAEAATEKKPIHSIIILGHSVGSLLGRKLYVVACGETSDAPFEKVYHDAYGAGLIKPRQWAPLIHRIVLLAGMNRGWQISHHLSPLNAMAWRVGVLIGYVIKLFTRRWLLIFKLRRGAEFITQLRIQWLQLRRRAEQSVSPEGPHAGRALTVQLLGSRDDIVSPEDNIDLVAGRDFVYLDVPFSGHADVVQLNDPKFGAARAHVLEQALCLSQDGLHEYAATPADDQFFAPNPHIKNVIFVIHGIRDQGFWTHKIARRVKRLAGSEAAEWATETSSYGYLPMLPFMLPWYRRRKVEWLMDQYAEALARYPNARFSYVGHSNGTYLIAKAIELYPCCRFDQIVFAGSVVRTGYDWQGLLNSTPPRVNAVLNFVATADSVVAFFPKFFQFSGLQDLGSAGHDGFDSSSESNGVFQVRYLKGGHSAALTEEVWDHIARFVIDGRIDMDKVPNQANEQHMLVKLIGRAPPLIWGAILVLLCAIWAVILCICNAIPEAEARGLAKGFALSGYLLLLWLVLTRL